MTTAIGIGAGIQFTKCCGESTPPPATTISLNDSGGQINGTDFIGQTDHDCSFISDGFELGVEGDIVVTQPNGSPTTYVGLCVGIWHPIETIGVVATGTDAASIKVGN